MRVIILAGVLALSAAPAFAGGPCRSAAEIHANHELCRTYFIHGGPAPAIGIGGPALLAAGGMVAAALWRKRRSR